MVAIAQLVEHQVVDLRVTGSIPVGHPKMQEFLSQFITNNSPLAVAVFFVFRILAIVIPPIPGSVVDLIGVSAFGKVWGFLYAEMAIIVGACMAFFIARYFREPLVKKFTSLQKVHEFEKNLSARKTFWTLVMLRLLTNSVFDYVSYAAGLTRINFGKFFFSSLLGSFPGMAVFYYFGELFFQKGERFFLFFIIIVLFVPFVFKKTNYLRKIYALLGIKNVQ